MIEEKLLRKIIYFVRKNFKYFSEMSNKNEYQDAVHGKIEKSDIIDAIIETDQFQRLKEIKQLGGLCFIYPEANHTRFEHCIGTYHLAQKMLTHLTANTPGLKIPKLYQDCVKIAGLLHDIGHGPFSHFWEDINPRSHEDNSKSCIDEIFSNLKCTLSNSAIEHYYGIELIKSLITGDKTELSRPIDRNYEFLFDIINNRQCGIDVDKWDYLKRDAHHVGHYVPKSVKFNLNFEEVFTTAIVSSNRSHIQFNLNVFDKIYDIFDTRSKFHIHLYQLPSNKAYEYILKRAVNLADKKGYKYCKFGGKLMSEITSDDKSLYLELTDNNILQFLREIEDDHIIELINCIDNRNLIEVKHFSNKNSFPIRIKLENGIKKMNKENIPFYGTGNLSDEPKMLQCGYYESNHYFACK